MIENEFSILVKQYFSFLESEFFFIKQIEESDSDHQIEYSSQEVSIRIEKYRREIYLYVSKPGVPGTEVHLFNLLRYLNRNTLDGYNYFSNINDIKQSYKLQLEFLSKELRKTYVAILDFFSDSKYQENILKLRAYLIEANPNLFKR